MDRPRSFRACTFSFSASSLACCSALCSSKISSIDTCWRGVSLSFSKSYKTSGFGKLHLMTKNRKHHGSKGKRIPVSGLSYLPCSCQGTDTCAQVTLYEERAGDTPQSTRVWFTGISVGVRNKASVCSKSSLRQLRTTFLTATSPAPGNPREKSLRSR